MLKWVILAFLSIVMIVGGVFAVFLAVDMIGANLQAEMQNNATLRRQVVQLEEENKVYGEVFECINLKSRLGLVTEEEKKVILEGP